MNPDYAAMVNDLIRPAVSFLLVTFMIMGWTVAYLLMKEVTELKIKLGRETRQEGFAEWFVRKKTTILLRLILLKNFILEIQLLSRLKELLRRKKKVWKFIFELE